MRPCDSVSGHALHAVRAGFELQPRIRAAAFDARNDFLEAAVFAGAGGFDLDLPALSLRIARVHAEQVAGEDRRLVAAGAGAHFQVDVAFVARVLGDQVREQFGVELLQPCAGRGDFLLGQFAQFRVAAHRLGGGQIAPGLLLGGQRRGDRLQLRELARELAERVRRRRSRRDRRAVVRVPRAVRRGLRVCGAGKESWAQDEGRRGFGHGRAQRSVRPASSNDQRLVRKDSYGRAALVGRCALRCAGNSLSAARASSALPLNAASRSATVGACSSRLVSVCARKSSTASGSSPDASCCFAFASASALADSPCARRRLSGSVRVLARERFRRSARPAARRWPRPRRRLRGGCGGCPRSRVRGRRRCRGTRP